MMQAWIAGLIVVFAAAYALWYWIPASLRARLFGRSSPLAKAPGCDSCSSCGGCASADQPKDAGAGAGADTRMHVIQIHRRAARS